MCPRSVRFDPSFPKSWRHVARAAVLHAVSLAATAMAVLRGRMVESRRRQVRQHAEIEQLHNEITLLREELRLEDARMVAVPPPRRPRYRPVQRMSRAGDPEAAEAAVGVEDRDKTGRVGKRTVKASYPVRNLDYVPHFAWRY